MTSKEKFLEFEAANKKDWKALVIKELKGKPYENLIWDTGEGFTVDPLYTLEELKNVKDAFPKNRGEFNYQNSWTIIQVYDNADLKLSNENIISGLTSGVQGLVIKAQKNESDYEVLLEGVFIDWIKLVLHTKEGASDLNLFLNYAKAKGINEKDIRGGLNFDPLNDILDKGNWAHSKEKDLKKIVETVEEGISLINFKTITVDCAKYGDRGSSIVNELAYGLACYHEYLLVLTENGVADDVALESIQVNLSIGRSFFMEMAKIKVFRLVHAQLLKSYDLKEKEVNIVSKSSQFELAPTDHYSNLLRITTHALAAGIAGADDVLLSSFNGENDMFSQRMSTNIQLLLLEESFLSKSEDVSAGSYVIEQMIDELSKNVWKKFKQIEAEGGWLKSVESGRLQKDIFENAEEKINALNAKERKWLGVNSYENKSEKKWSSTEIKKDAQVENPFQKLHLIQHNF